MGEFSHKLDVTAQIRNDMFIEVGTLFLFVHFSGQYESGPQFLRHLTGQMRGLLFVEPSDVEEEVLLFLGIWVLVKKYAIVHGASVVQPRKTPLVIIANGDEMDPLVPFEDLCEDPIEPHVLFVKGTVNRVNHRSVYECSREETLFPRVIVYDVDLIMWNLFVAGQRVRQSNVEEARWRRIQVVLHLTIKDVELGCPGRRAAHCA